MRQHKSAPARISLVPLCAIATALALAGCGGVPTNRSMESVHQPVVEKVEYALDVTTDGSGLAYGEQARLAGWFDAMGLKYGDRVFVDDPTSNPDTRNAIESVAARYGILVSEQAPQTVGYVTGGTARVIITRTKASVPGCPDWSSNSDANPNNGLSSNYGCAVNSNLAAMVADPEDLIQGERSVGPATTVRSNKAIGAYRDAEPTGKGNAVSEAGTREN